jgi:hypothetical protein
MAKFAADSVYDASLDAIAAATEMYFCNGQPTSRADAITRQSAAAITLTSGDFAKSTVSGNRVLTVAAKSATATVSQTTDHIALCTGTTLLYVTTAPAQTTNSGSSVGSAAFTITASDVV